jgi:hypothetical protein
MNRSVRSCILLVSITGISGAMAGQTSAPLSDPARVPCMEDFGDQQSLYTISKPFVASWTTTTIQTRADGADSAPMVSLVKMARDSSGKVYRETQNRPQKGQPNRSFSVEDPVSGTTYGWFEGDKVVTVFHSAGVNSPEVHERLRKSPFGKKIWIVPLCATFGPDSGYDTGEFSIQNLGTSHILGTDAQGILATRNDELVTEERWYSSDLQIALTTRVSDSRFGCVN